VNLAPFDQNLLIPLDLSRLRQIVIIKSGTRLLTEMLEFESSPGSQLLCHSMSCEHFQEIRPFDDEVSTARITINCD